MPPCCAQFAWWVHASGNKNKHTRLICDVTGENHALLGGARFIFVHPRLEDSHGLWFERHDHSVSCLHACLGITWTGPIATRPSSIAAHLIHQNNNIRLPFTPDGTLRESSNSIRCPLRLQFYPSRTRHRLLIIARRISIATRIYVYRTARTFTRFPMMASAVGNIHRSSVPRPGPKPCRRPTAWQPVETRPDLGRTLDRVRLLTHMLACSDRPLLFRRYDAIWSGFGPLTTWPLLHLPSLLIHHSRLSY